jgi:DNA segregation ATPase FtsK/SpoIIIE-like protein
MQSEPGYVYALINHAMPGLVKIGRTTRAPSERLEELSGATGVPSPFELVYDVLVADAAAAEQFIHAQLTARGYRLSESREFFRAPLREVLRLMVHLRESIESSALATSTGVATSDWMSAAQDVDEDRDRLLFEAASICVTHRDGSAVLLQRRLKIGYGRAARLIDQLHAAGVLGPANGAKPREVLVGLDQLATLR